MIIHRAQSQQHGFSMLEVLIAVLVFSLGMLGLAGLLIFAIQSNNVAYLRTQATFLAHNMADRMGANPAGLWNGDYNGTYPVSASSASCSAGCTPAELASHDKQQWSTQLTTFLPGAAGAIECTLPAGIPYTPPAAQYGLRPPYGGTCQMTLTWNEARVANAEGDYTPHLHTFAWTFQP
jgi:type IV pilus assembly protein PilV